MKISASTVFEVLARFKATSLPRLLPDAMSHDAQEKRLFPAKGKPLSCLVMRDLIHFVTEMRKPGVTRQLLWMEYKAQAGELAMGYSHLCRCYREWKKRVVSLCARSTAPAKNSLSTSAARRSSSSTRIPEKYAG